MEKQKLRSEIDNKYKWDLTTLFKTDTDFLNELESVKKDMVGISKYEELIKKDLTCLYDMIHFDYEISYRLEKLNLYTFK